MPHKSVTERLSEHAARHLQARSGENLTRTTAGKSLSVPLCNSNETSPINTNDSKRKQALCKLICRFKKTSWDFGLLIKSLFQRKLN